MGVIFSNNVLAFRSARLQMARLPEVLLRLNELQSKLDIGRDGLGLVEWFVTTPTLEFLPQSPLAQSVGVVTQVALYDRYRSYCDEAAEAWVAEGLGLWALQIVRQEKTLFDLAQALRAANSCECDMLSLSVEPGCWYGTSIQGGPARPSSRGVDSVISQLPSQRWLYMGLDDLNLRRLQMQLPATFEVVDVLKADPRFDVFQAALTASPNRTCQQLAFH